MRADATSAQSRPPMSEPPEIMAACWHLLIAVSGAIALGGAGAALYVTRRGPEVDAAGLNQQSGHVLRCDVIGPDGQRRCTDLAGHAGWHHTDAVGWYGDVWAVDQYAPTEPAPVAEQDPTVAGLAPDAPTDAVEAHDRCTAGSRRSSGEQRSAPSSAPATRAGLGTCPAHSSGGGAAHPQQLPGGRCCCRRLGADGPAANGTQRAPSLAGQRSQRRSGELGSNRSVIQ